MIAAAHDASDASALTSARRYDDFFFVNAHGVFGFINSHRPVLSLMYAPPLHPLHTSRLHIALEVL